MKARTLIDEATYNSMYQRSIADPDGFWSDQANAFLLWQKPWQTVSEADMPSGNIRWFDGGQLNVSVNCIDRHLPHRAKQTAIIWEGDEPSDDTRISYQELYERVCQLANGLRARGVKKGDRVCIYMPMIPEAAYAMLACARIGAIHSVVFGGFSPQSLKDRILDSDCQTVITADEGMRGGKAIPLKANTDAALASCPDVHTVVTVRRTGGDISWQEGRDIWYSDLASAQPKSCEPEIVESEDPLFILYTSGSTGKPKGVQHSSAGYLLHAAISHKYVFDYQDGDVYWCTADVLRVSRGRAVLVRVCIGHLLYVMGRAVLEHQHVTLTRLVVVVRRGRAPLLIAIRVGHHDRRPVRGGESAEEEEELAAWRHRCTRVRKGPADWQGADSDTNTHACTRARHDDS